MSCPSKHWDRLSETEGLMLTVQVSSNWHGHMIPGVSVGSLGPGEMQA